MTNKPTTYLGSQQLHRRHSVMIEGGLVPRAKVMDQHIIDRYLMDGEIDLAQYHAGELVLRQAAMARMWPRGVDLSSITASRGVPNYVPFGVFSFGGTMNYVADNLSRGHARVLRDVIVYDVDVRAKKPTPGEKNKNDMSEKMVRLREALGLISNRFCRARGFRAFVSRTQKKGAATAAPIGA